MLYECPKAAQLSKDKPKAQHSIGAQQPSTKTHCAMASAHRRQVLALYRHLLRLHSKLPSDFAQVGSAFVKEEFRRHKTASLEYSVVFLREWTMYADSLEQQLNEGGKLVGENFPQRELVKLDSEQIEQLQQLKQETRRPPSTHGRSDT